MAILTADLEFQIDDPDLIKRLAGQEIEVGFAAPYAPYVEYGTHPHGVGPQGQQNLRRWIQRKVRYKDKSGRPRKLKENEVEALLEKILWSIRKKGTRAHPFFRPAIEFTKTNGGAVLVKTGDLEAVGKMCLKEASKNLNRRDEHGWKINDTGHLLNSGFVRKVK